LPGFQVQLGDHFIFNFLIRLVRVIGFISWF